MKIKQDIRILQTFWMSLVFSNQRNAHPVAGKYNKNSTLDLAKYKSWFYIGLLISIMIYPILAIGVILKIFKDGLSSVVSKFGIYNTLAVFFSVWSVMSVTSYSYYNTTYAVSILLSVSVATISGALSYLTSRRSYVLTILVSYPMAYIALLLPPVAFAVLNPDIGGRLINSSRELILFLQTDIAQPIGLRSFFDEMFDLTNKGHVIFWTISSIFFGWFTGLCTELALLVEKYRSLN